MEKSVGNNIKLGLFISISILLLIVGIYFVGDRNKMFSNTFHVSGIFKDISGLQVGNNVRFSGINVGIIEDIEQITDTTVRVDMMIDMDNQQFMKKTSKAVIGNDGLMGNKIIVITPGTNSTLALEDNDTITTSQPITMDDILLKLKLTVDNAAVISNDLALITNNIKDGKGTIGKLFMDSTFAENLDKALLNVRQGAKGFKQNMDAASKNVLLNGFLKKKKKK